MLYSSYCDDFYINMRLASQLALPHGRETVLHFFERIQKQFPAMTRFKKLENNDMSIEESRENSAYRWVTLENRRIVSGHVNPESIEEALNLHTLVLQQAPFELGISPIEMEYLDVVFGFDMQCRGNHDEVIAESLLRESPLSCLLDEPSAKAVDIQPTITVALSEDCRLQARIDVVTRTNSHQVRTGEYGNDVISVYLILRRYWGDRPKEPMEQILEHLTRRAADLCETHVFPRVLKPISCAIELRS